MLAEPILQKHQRAVSAAAGYHNRLQASHVAWRGASTARGARETGAKTFQMRPTPPRKPQASTRRRQNRGPVPTLTQERAGARALRSAARPTGLGAPDSAPPLPAWAVAVTSAPPVGPPTALGFNHVDPLGSKKRGPPAQQMMMMVGVPHRPHTVPYTRPGWQRPSVWHSTALVERAARQDHLEADCLQLVQKLERGSHGGDDSGDGDLGEGTLDACRHCLRQLIDKSREYQSLLGTLKAHYDSSLDHWTRAYLSAKARRSDAASRVMQLDSELRGISQSAEELLRGLRQQQCEAARHQTLAEAAQERGEALVRSAWQQLDGVRQSEGELTEARATMELTVLRKEASLDRWHAAQEKENAAMWETRTRRDEVLEKVKSAEQGRGSLKDR
jgi:hypothetical protein